MGESTQVSGDFARVLGVLAGQAPVGAVVLDAVRRLCGERPLRSGPALATHWWPRLIEVATAQRLLAAVLELVAQGALSGPAEYIAELRVRTEEWALHELAVERGSARVLTALGAAEVPVRVLKGMATSKLDHRRSDLRSFGDIDLLVPTSRLDLAVDALRGAGLQPDRRIFSVRRHLYRGETLTDPIGVEVDLHSHLSRLVRPPLDWSSVADGELLRIGGREAMAAPAPARCVHAAIHLLGSDGAARRLSGVADCILLGGRADVPAPAMALASSYGVGWLFAQTMRAAYVWAGLKAPSCLADQVPPTRWERAVWRTYGRPERRPVRSHLLFAAAQPDVPRAVRYVVGQARAQVR